MTKLDEETQHNLEILKALNRAIEEGHWDYNLFLKATGQKLVEIRDRFRDNLKLDSVTDASSSALLSRMAQSSGLQEVYISLFNADGSNMTKWNAILSTLSTHAISRPVYRAEGDAKAVLRAATNKQNEAYVAVFVREEDILKIDPNNPNRDRYGHQLVTLKDKAIHRDLVTRLIHVSGIYEYEDGQLNRQGSAEFL